MKGICPMEDKISHLPDHVLHEILSLLSRKDAKKTSILSKRWNSIWNSFPRLVLDQYEFRFCKKLSRNHKKVKANFCDSVDRTMQRRYQNSIFTERLDISIYHGIKVLKHLDSWIDWAVTMKVNQLILVIYHNQDGQDYVLPQCVWNSQWLRVLRLQGCEFSGSNMSGMVGIGSSLRKLRLHRVRIDESTFDYVISSCFHLEDLQITWCVGFKVLNVVGLKGIHTVRLHLSDDESVFIEAPGLQFLRFHGDSSNLRRIIEACFLKKLKEICLVKTDIEVDEFDKFIPEFPWLEKLELNNCKLQESFTVSSGRLMSFSLNECDNVRHIKLDTCCLNQLSYNGNCRLDITWVEASDEVKINHDYCLGYYNHYSYGISFDKIAMYLINLSFCKVLTLIYGESKWIASQALGHFSCNIEQLRIKITNRHGQIGRWCQSMLKDFLQISRRPSSVLIELGGKKSLLAFMKLDFLYEQEIDKGQLNGNCACGDWSCWRCCLGELQVSQSVHAMRGKDATKLVEFFKANALSLKKINVESKADIHSQAFDWCLADPQMKINGPPRHLVLSFP